MSFFLFAVSLVPCALARNIETMLVARFCSGFFDAAFISVAGGTVSDLFTGHDLQTPMMVYPSSPLYVNQTSRELRDFVVAALAEARIALVLASDRSSEGSSTSMLQGKLDGSEDGKP